jgi:uncharacterized membrane protein YbhN (UPF0104 family)
MRRFTQFLPSLLGVLFLFVSLWAISQELSQYQPSQIWHSLTSISPRAIVLAIAFTFLSCIAFAGYDTLAVQYVRQSLPWYKTALVGVTSIPVSNAVGLALLSGGAIRYRFYAPWGFSAIQIAQIITFCNVSFWLGLFTAGGVLFVLQPVTIPGILHLPFQSVRPIGVIFLSIIGTYLAWNGVSQRSLKLGSWLIPHLSFRLCCFQLAVASVDWILAATVLYTLLPSQPAYPYSGFFSIYFLAQLAGVVSNVPGGLGVFETVVLLLLSPTFSSVVLFGILLAYRVIYYLLPLVIAIIFLVSYEFRQRRR